MDRYKNALPKLFDYQSSKIYVPLFVIPNLPHRLSMYGNINNHCSELFLNRFDLMLRFQPERDYPNRRDIRNCFPPPARRSFRIPPRLPAPALKQAAGPTDGPEIFAWFVSCFILPFSHPGRGPVCHADSLSASLPSPGGRSDSFTVAVYQSIVKGAYRSCIVFASFLNSYEIFPLSHPLPWIRRRGGGKSS